MTIFRHEGHEGHEGWLRVCVLIVGGLLIAGCSPAPQPDSSAATPAASSSGAYTPPAAGTSSLVASIDGRRDASGQVTVTGRLLLPEGARMWVDLYAVSAPASADPTARAELYLGPNGSFEAGPFKMPADAEFRYLVTSHFTQSWQSSDVLALIGRNGTRLPKTALKLDSASFPDAGGHLEQSGTVKISG